MLPGSDSFGRAQHILAQGSSIHTVYLMHSTASLMHQHVALGPSRRSAR